MIIYEGYFNDSKPTSDDIVSDVEQSLKNKDSFDYYLEISYMIGRQSSLDKVDRDKTKRRIAYVFSNISCLESFLIDDNVNTFDMDETNKQGLTYKVWFNVDETSNYKDFNKFIYALKHNLTFCLDGSIKPSKDMIGKVGSVMFFYKDGNPILTGNKFIVIGPYQYNTLYYSDTHLLYHILFPDNKDMHLLDTDEYSRNKRQKVYERIFEHINEYEEIKNVGLQFKVIKVSVADLTTIYVTKHINFVSLELTSTKKKIKNIDVNKLAEIIQRAVLDKIPMHIERAIGPIYIIVKPVDFSVKLPEIYFKSKEYIRQRNFGNTLTACYLFPENSGISLVITKKDGTTVSGSGISSFYTEIVGCVNQGLCW